MSKRILLACFAILAPVCAQPTQRDIVIDKGQPENPSTPGIPRSYALVVGIAKYPNLSEQWQLQYPERDAEAIYSILISPEGGNFHAENVHRLIGSKATLANLRNELEQWLPSVAKADDRVLIYFAGHGFVYQGRAYLAPYDISAANVAGTAYPMDALGAAIGGKIQAKAKMLFTDACHSGAIRPEDTVSMNRAVIDVQKSLFSLSASRDREQSFESSKWGGGHGIFTYYVVRGLEGEADENGDGVVTADELQDYVYTNVRQATSGRQNPTSDQGSFDPQMLLAYAPSRVEAAAPPAAKYGSFIFESNMDGVEVFLDGKSLGVVNKGQPFPVPGLTPGIHVVQGVKMGYEPDGPREETVYPGQDTTVSIRLLIARRRTRAAIDALDHGVAWYNKGYAQNYRKAVEEFQKALSIDPAYSQAALYLGRAYNALFDDQQADKYFQLAIHIDPDYLEAHASYGGMLLDTGNIDEAVRQFNIVIQRAANNVQAFTHLAQAYRMKEAYRESMESARKAIQLAPQYGEPHLWLADSLRLTGAYDAARIEYGNYLRLSNFESGLAGQLNYYVVGFLVGLGRKNRPAQEDIWKDLRSLAYFGLCDSERKQSLYTQAIEDCQKALTYDSKDPFSHYALAMAYSQQAVSTGNREMIAAALQHFRAMLEIDPDLEQASYARQNIANIERVLQTQ